MPFDSREIARFRSDFRPFIAAPPLLVSGAKTWERRSTMKAGRGRRLAPVTVLTICVARDAIVREREHLARPAPRRGEAHSRRPAGRSSTATRRSRAVLPVRPRESPSQRDRRTPPNQSIGVVDHRRSDGEGVRAGRASIGPRHRRAARSATADCRNDVHT